MTAATSDQPRAILFDLDGTVLDTLELIYQCYTKTVTVHCGRDGDRVLWEGCTGLPLRELFGRTFTAFGRTLDEPTLAAAVQTYREFLHASDGRVRVFPGVRETLEELRDRGLPLGIVTTKHEVSALRHLRLQGLEPLFDVVVAGDHCAHYKPHPEPFLKAAEALGVPPARAVAVGDSEHDIEGAHAAGMPAVAALWGTIRRARLLAAAPEYRAETPAGLLGLWDR